MLRSTAFALIAMLNFGAGVAADASPAKPAPKPAIVAKPKSSATDIAPRVVFAKIAQALDIPLAQFFAEDSLGREMNTQKLTDDELRFLTQIRRYATNLNDSDRKLLLAMVKKFAATAVR